MKTNILLILTILLSLQSNAQLFIDDGPGGSLYITGTSGGTLASPETISNEIALYVDSNIVIEGTYVNNSAEVQLTGSFYNTGVFTTTGDEVFTGTKTQIVSGSFTGSTNFNNLLLNKTSSSMVNLGANIEIDSSGILHFENGGIIKTNANYLLINNTSANAISGYGSSGNLDKFIEGELRRNIISGNTYTFPVGGTHTDSGGGDGIQYAAIKSNNGGGILAVLFNDSTGTGQLDSMVICPSGTGDYQDTEYRIDNGSWEITNPSGGIINYDLTLAPADYTDNGYVDYTIIQNGLPTGRDKCDGIASTIPITHDSLTFFTRFEIAASTNSTLLPIQLISFNASVVNNTNVKLDWQTVTEINNDYFTIEHSADQVNWEEISKMDGAGNSSTLLSYQTLDKHPYLNTSYYRLKQTDFNGKYSYSQIRSVSIDNIYNSNLSIYPNPTNGQLTINGSSEELEQIHIYNILGEEIPVNSRIMEKKDLKVILNLSDLTTGMYYIKTKNAVNKVYKH